MAANTLAWKHWTRIISRWPVDKVRPEAVSFQTLMKQRLAKYENTAKAAEQAKVKGTAANAQPVDLQWNDGKEMKQANALYALLENRFASVNPLPETLRFPASQPEHYDMIIRETENAPRRGVIEKFSTKVKNMFRWT